MELLTLAGQLTAARRYPPAHFHRPRFSIIDVARLGPSSRFNRARPRPALTVKTEARDLAEEIRATPRTSKNGVNAGRL